jgi:apolipoprotein N-acyltransferase
MSINKPAIWQLSGHVLAGMVASLCLPPFGLVPLIAALSWPALGIARARSSLSAARIGAAAGFGWFLASTWWISLSLFASNEGYWPVLPFAVFGIPALLMLFWIPAALLARRFGVYPASRLVWFLVLLTLCEWGRGYIATGFPWNAPGYLFSAHISLLQSASVLGLFGLTLVALAFALVPAFWVVGWRKSAAVILLVLPLMAVAGHIRLTDLPASEGASEANRPKWVRLVQPMVAQDEKWNKQRRPEHLATLQSLSRDSMPVPQLVIWPESAFAGLLNDEADLLSETVWSTLPFDGWLISGVPRLDSQSRLFNSAALIRANGKIEMLYDKRRLVPFGEFVPFRDFLPFADIIAGPTDFSAGAKNAIFSVSGYGRIQMLICYEAIFPGVAAGPGPRPDILVNITNDGWFGDSPGPWQHLAQARMRAVEEGIPMVRVANTGVSAAFDGAGRQLAMIGLGEQGFVDVDIPPPLEVTIYAELRQLILILILFFMLIMIVSLDRRFVLRQKKRALLED